MNIKHFLLVPSFIMAAHISDAKVLQSRNNACVYEHPQREAEGVRDIVWFTPSRAKKINGLAIGLAAVPAEKNTQEINGVNIELNPIVFFTMVIPIYWTAYHLSHEYKTQRENKSKVSRNRTAVNDSEIREVISGLDIATISMEHTASKGVSISALGTFAFQKGVALSAVLNANNHFKGAQIAPLCNISSYGKGLSVALVNVCNNCSGLQIGLINKNGKRTTPFFSYRSKKKAKKIASEHHIAEVFFQ